MKSVSIKARIKRNKLDVLAGKYYVDDNSDIVKYLNSLDKKALVGIQREDGIYTIIGEENVYYLSALGIEGAIPLGEFLQILSKNALALGKTALFEFIKIKEDDAIWLQNAHTMNAMWNTMLLLNN